MTGVSAALDSVSVNTRLVVPLSPSRTVVSSITTWRPSSSKIVPTACPSLIDALTAPFRVTVKLSSLSLASSPTTGTVIVWTVVPGTKVSVPLVVV